MGGKGEREGEGIAEGRGARGKFGGKCCLQLLKGYRP